jgi:hypothetical protein
VNSLVTANSTDSDETNLEISDVVKESFAFYRPVCDDIRKYFVTELAQERHIK